VTRERRISAIDLLPERLPPSATPRPDTGARRRPPSSADGRRGSRLWPSASPGTFLPPVPTSLRNSLQEDGKYEGQAMTDQSSVGIYFADK
jgi:hypothetical protein